MVYQPQARTERNTTAIMLYVIIALIPAMAAAVWQHGIYQLGVLAVSAVAAVVFEWIYERLTGKPSTVGDLSACVTGILLAMTLPCGCPLWLPVIGDFIAIVIVKQLYGGIGCNVLNPALAGRVVLLLFFPSQMSAWTVPNSLAAYVDGATSATPLSYLYGESGMPVWMSLKTLFLGATGGCIGEISTLALLAGGGYLLIRGVINWQIPAGFLGGAALAALLTVHPGYSAGEWILCNLCSGGLALAAFFMATDYTTSPLTSPGRLVYGIGCGILTIFLRERGSYPEAVSFAVLTMNLLSWALDMLFHRKPFGTSRVHKTETGGAGK